MLYLLPRRHHVAYCIFSELVRPTRVWRRRHSNFLERLIVKDPSTSTRRLKECLREVPRAFARDASQANTFFYKLLIDDRNQTIQRRCSRVALIRGSDVGTKGPLGCVSSLGERACLAREHDLNKACIQETKPLLQVSK